MKKIQFIALSLCGLYGRKYCTANTVAEDVAALNQRLEESNALIADLQKQIQENKAAASRPIEVDELDLGPFQLPEGLDKKDVIWRKRAGLDTKQAVEAALAQKKHDEAAAAQKAVAAKTAKK